ncbi:hypothetical protein CAOG_06440 [Capsaspora owczarzaki ATCC 30864]|uniref:hypothetical protein n=1 Tax=Capsaspora owczarzaki (strain ATCC 30864) TaxID=595528 RepID=UPI0001FE2BA6|nr:hypothetical protein CAOG_06440 [Capsaspora owczarzaki ATCC 30864]|eukprot:XP_004345189.1 hypothetical protein CAOG_06440 [Capsaspora owczarzaki ATCC 30864]
MTASAPVLLFLFCAAVATAASAWAAPVPNDTPRVVLVSIDGMRYDYLTRAYNQGDIRIPNLLKLIRGGVWSPAGAISEFPAVTFPSHTSMITGVPPARHGIVANNLLDPANTNADMNYFYPGITAQTVFDACNSRNFTTAAIDWPVTVGAPITYLFPGNVDAPNSLDEARWLFSACKGPVYDILPTPQSMRQVSDDQRGQIAQRFHTDLLPQFMALHYDDLDEIEHATGVMSQAAIAQLEYIDASLGDVIATVQKNGVFDSTTWIVVSDHGFSNISTVISPATVFEKYNLTTPQNGLDYVAYYVSSGGCSAIYVNANASTAQRTLVDQALNEFIAQNSDSLYHVWSPAELLPYAAFPDAYVVLESNLNVMFVDNPAAPVVSKATHGWSPNHGAEMRASFLAYGANIRSNVQIDSVRLIDIAPTIAAIMGLDMPSTEGRVLSELFVS